MFTCEICNKNCKSQRSLLSHIKHTHNMTSKIYYDKFIKQPNEGICPICYKETKFTRFSNGYRHYCSSKCAANSLETKQKRESTNLNKFGCINVSQNSEIKLKKETTCLNHLGVKNPIQSNIIKESIKTNNKEKFGTDWITQSNYFKNKSKETCLNKYGKDNYRKTEECIQKATKTLQLYINEMLEKGYIPISELFVKYGYGWYEAHIVKIYNYKHKAYIHESDLNKIVEYSKSHEFSTRSKLENIVIDNIQKYYKNSFILNSRKIIKPYELDIYLPDKQIAFEVNGNYRHSIEGGINKNYHFMKSMLCKQNKINLVHIFEDSIKDSTILDTLIQNVLNTKHPIQNEIICDFNINNGLIYEQLGYKLIKYTGPELIKTSSYTIYGSGKIIYTKGNEK